MSKSCTKDLVSVVLDLVRDVSALCDEVQGQEKRIAKLEASGEVDLKADFLELKSHVEKLPQPDQDRATVKLLKLASYFGVKLEEEK